MKITVGVKSLKEAEYFFANGAEEVYCGLLDLPNNRLPYENFLKPADILPVIKLAARTGKKAFLAANVILKQRDYPGALKLISGMAEAGLSGVILRDPALLAYFKRKKFRFHFTLSTLANCFNVRALEFFSGLGISRIVLPMQMMPMDAAGLIKNRFGIDTEVFCQAFYYGINVDSRCELPCPQDGKKEPGRYRDFTCLLPFKSRQGIFHMPMPHQDYMLGAFYDYYKAGVKHLKIARWPNTPREIDLFLKVRRLLGLLEQGTDRKVFIQKGLRLDSKPLEYGKSFTFKPFRS
ncbi:MAG: hypothetical protein A2234_03185 [Elusimicrobia bacterium RIFOXYA2_FULL_58_8]|nr:MAG: hypothetical protein A2234_03185 [Elusimicrobia bacterium RIFOXYA2_FULL_58_8]